jgi:hypothetical protein
MCISALPGEPQRGTRRCEIHRAIVYDQVISGEAEDRKGLPEIRFDAQHVGTGG